MRKEEEGKVVAAEVKVGAGQGERETVEGYRVVAESSIQVMGSSAREHAKEREKIARAKRDENRVQHEREGEEANCLLIRPDNCRWAWTHLVSNHLDLTLPRTFIRHPAHHFLLYCSVFLSHFFFLETGSLFLSCRISYIAGDYTYYFLSIKFANLAKSAIYILVFI